MENIDPATQQKIATMQAQVQLRAAITGIHQACFEKCIPDKPGSKTIGTGQDSRTDSCFKNCTERFLETSEAIVQKWQNKFS
eukprot:m.335807 g.335807  ORF g.335807 m.335807 type:complete len:82 (-) comp17680_c0_seq1:46-291(-)